MDGFLAATGHLDSVWECVEFRAERHRPIGEIDRRLAFSTQRPPRRTRAARADASEESSRSGPEENEPVHAAPSGFGIEADGCYVWDEDRREAEEWAIELTGPAFPKRS
jgi:hypothetical protein